MPDRDHIEHVIPGVGFTRVELYPPADQLYEALRRAREVNRLQRLRHLGALSHALPGARHARWDYRFIERTIETELVEELAFLANYEQTKRAIQEIVDMPDRQIDLLIRFCLENHGRLSAQKRGSHFAALSNDEIARMEEAVKTAYGSATSAEE